MTREEAIKALRETYCGNRAFCELFKIDHCRTTDCEIYHAIKALEAEPKHGRWIDVEPAPWGQVYETCSECGIRQSFDNGHDKFCGVCGAKMDEVEE